MKQKNQKLTERQAQRVIIAFATWRKLKKYRTFSDDELIQKILGNLEKILE